MSNLPRLPFLCAAILLGAFGLRPAPATLRQPTDWPVERLLENVGRYVASHPEAAEAHYCLGRIHTYAFVFETARVAVNLKPEEDFASKLAAGAVTLDQLAELVLSTRAQEHLSFAARFEQSTPEQQRLDLERLASGLRGQAPLANANLVEPGPLLGHLVQAIRSLRRALELDPENGAFHLTLAYVLERGAHLADQVDNRQLFGSGDIHETPVPDRILDLGRPESAEAAYAELVEPKRLASAFFQLDRLRASPEARLQRSVARLLERRWMDQAVEHYRQAFERCVDVDREMKGAHDFTGIVGLEAGEAYLRLTKDERERFPEPEGFRERLDQGLFRLRRIPFLGAITPIVLAVDRCRTLDELVAPDHTVLFDLDGDLVEEPWPWLRPDAGWLVWDPKHTGRITSGRQLFGSASGWFLFPDGYRVLDALDDDGSGELCGAELTGIAVWFDRDSDGVSDGGEVVPVEALGIVALATEATERVGSSLGNPCGLELADGRVLPTYDWVLAPAPSP